MRSRPQRWAARADLGSLTIILASLIGFATIVWLKSMPGPEQRGQAVAWTTALAAIVATGAALFLLRHRARRVSGRGLGPQVNPFRGRELPQPRHPTAHPHAWYRGRSHSGGRPRFD